MFILQMKDTVQVIIIYTFQFPVNKGILFGFAILKSYLRARIG